MPSGGSRVRSGPAPTSQDRSHKGKAQAEGWITLPADGRDGPEPHFPLADASPRELELWSRLWETPQATMWEQLHQDFEVACYVRLLVSAEKPRSSAIIWSQVKQFAESLGLSVSGMQRNKWTVGIVDQAEDEDDEPANGPADDFDDRLRLVIND